MNVLNSRSSRNSTTVALSAIAIALGHACVPHAAATPTADNVVINEVYGGGGNSGSVFSHDFIELYNPTSHPITLDGWSVQYLSPAATSGANITELKGSIQPGGYFLIKGAKGANEASDFTADITNDALAMGGKSGGAVLVQTTQAWTPGAAAIDLIGYGSVHNSETAPAAALTNAQSAARTTAGADSDNNETDFTVGSPTPQASNNAPAPTDPPTPAEPTAAASRKSIEEIQGTGESTPFAGQKVETAGWVTASYPEGGLNGFFIQMGGSSEPRSAGQASRALFVYSGSGAPAPVNKCVIVTGTAEEFKGSTQLSGVSTRTSTAPDKDCGTAVSPSTASIPTEPAVREANEGMLFQPSAQYTVTNNYDLNSFGSVDLVEGDKPLYQATSQVKPGPEAVAYEAQNAARVITLDDASTANFLRNTEAQNTPLPYLSAADGIRSLRAGDRVSFQQPVVLAYNFNKWGLQPTQRITGTTDRTQLPITWKDSRTDEATGPEATGGTQSIASFNVLNYFTRLGQDEAGCDSYKDRKGNPVTAKDCTVRGAYTDKAFADQQAKIVKAINTLDVSVLGLEEIENSAKFGADRDEALAALVKELNAAGGHWEYVKSPALVPAEEDVIRTGFIYNPDKVTPVGDSRILDHEAFNGIARQPLAQAFRPTGSQGDKELFVAVVNHYKSKGSVARGDADAGDGQGNNASLRKVMSETLVDWLGQQADWKGRPQFVMGDFNAYAKEDAITTLEGAGFTNVEDHFEAGHSYQFGGRLGSLDHVMANEAAMKLTQGADVWDINSDESNAFEYSRRNYNVTDFYAADPFRSSDHDPIRVGFNTSPDATSPAPTPDGSDSETDGSLAPGKAGGYLSTGAGRALLGLGIAGLIATVLGGGALSALNSGLIPRELINLIPGMRR